MQLSEPADEYAPDGQIGQLVAPVIEVYVPAVQDVHSDAPTPEYVPAAQLKQLDDETDPVPTRKDPAAQLEQAPTPVDDEKADAGRRLRFDENVVRAGHLALQAVACRCIALY